MATGDTRGFAQARGLCGRREVPALPAVPFDQRRGAAVDGDHRRGLRHRQPPQRQRPGFVECEPRHALVAQRGPAGGRAHRVLAFAAELRTSGFDGRHGAAQPQAQHARAGHMFEPAARVQRQRASAPFVEQAQRIGLAAGEGERGLGGRHGQHLEAHFGDHAQRAERTGQHARDVVAGDVLHHLAAEAQHLGAAIDEHGAEHVVAHRAHAGTRRAAEAGGDHAADGSAICKAQRLERQALALFSKRGLELGQRRAGTHGDDQFAGFVARDASERAQVEQLEQLAIRRLAVEVLGAAAAQAQRRGIGRGGAHALDDLLEGGVHVRHRVLRISAGRDAPAGRRAPPLCRTRRSAAAWESPCRG
ncbi:hypothetical protein D9M68_474220 [compost metagenome]